MSGQHGVDVAVVGTGVVGLAVAHALLARGLTVAVLGPRLTAAVSGRASAMLSLFSEVDAGQSETRVELEVSQRLNSFARYPAWLDGLATASDRPPIPLVPGTWVVATDAEHDDMVAIARAAHFATHPVELHSGTTIGGLWPEVAPATALWLPTESSLDSARLLGTLSTAVAAHRGARWCDAAVTSLTTDDMSVRLRCACGGVVECERIVLAEGAGIPALLGERSRDLGVPPVLAERGVSMVLGTPIPLVYTVRTPNAAFACGTHLVPRGDGTIYLGATNRFTLTPQLDGAATLDEIAVLIGDATRVIEQRLSSVELLRTQVDYRSYTLDHLPLVGPTADPRVLLATATYRSGVLLAPLLADLVTDEITEPGSLATHPYRADRPIPTPQLSDLLTSARQLAALLAAMAR